MSPCNWGKYRDFLPRSPHSPKKDPRTLPPATLREGPTGKPRPVEDGGTGVPARDPYTRQKKIPARCGVQRSVRDQRESRGWLRRRRGDCPAAGRTSNQRKINDTPSAARDRDRPGTVLCLSTASQSIAVDGYGK